MKRVSLVLWFCLFLVSTFLRESKAASQGEDHGVYIVYMGAKGSPDDHIQLLSSITTRRKNAVVHTYKNSFSGFAARLTDDEAQSIAQHPGVVSVFPDPVFQLHTTRSWDFLRDQYNLVHDLPYSSHSNSTSNGADTIIGIFDTGIWPESESFNDKGIGPVPSRWKGTCTRGHDFKPSSCNRKLIGARFYDSPGETNPPSVGTPRDHEGHGTHIAAIAAGSPVAGASYYGLAGGTAKGGSPGSRIAVYRTCKRFAGCSGSDIMKAFDDAIADGVNIINLSFGQPAGAEYEFSKNPIAIGAFHAVEKGIFVVASAGNDGPAEESVVNVAPWIFTVAATTIDRNIETHIPLGGNQLIKGGGISFSNLNRSPVYPLADSLSVKLNSAFDGPASDCEPDTLDARKVKGKIIVCDHLDDDFSIERRLNEVKKKGGIGFILSLPDDELIMAPKMGSFPGAVITQGDGTKIRSYINSTRNPVATILPTVSVDNFKPAPVVAFFSSRGPNYNTGNLLKPDIAAPGTAILAAWPANDAEVTRSGQKPPLFNIDSGTSLACPHVSAIVATLKSQNPTWSLSAIRSAIMTTAFQQSNSKSPMLKHISGEDLATPYDIGAGVATMSGPLKPGLVYETEITDYLQFLCSTGYNTSMIKLILKTLPNNFSCLANSSAELVSNMNYPSIAVSLSELRVTKKVTRTVTRIGDEESVYTATITTPDTLRVQVSPKKLKFTSNTRKLSYQVTFKAMSQERVYFGSITWTNGKYKVRSPFVASW